MFLTYIFLLLTVLLILISNIVGDTDCLAEYSCVNTTIIETTGTISCNGLASCADSWINNVDDNSGGARTTCCWGKRSCQSAKTFLGEVTYAADIRAFLGLSWSNYVGSSKLNCYGEASCIEIVNATCETLINCVGLRTCQGIHGYYSDTVKGYGFLSLHNSILYNPSKIYLDSFFAGYNASIYCESGNTCEIYCYVNGCENLNLICDNGATCNVYYCNDTQGSIICPNGWNGKSYEYNMENSIYYDTITLINDIFKTGDGYDYIFNDSIYILDIYSNNECDSNDYECNDVYGCIYDSFNNLNNLCCNGHDACQTITVSNKFNNIYCDSSYACWYATINGNSNNNNNNGNIYLRGRYGAAVSDISYFNIIFASGERACQSCQIWHGYAVGCFSYLACYKATIINVTNIFAIGYQSFLQTSIISGGDGNEMNVFLLGYDNGDRLNVTCLNNDICNIYCITDNVGCNDESAVFECGGNSNDCTINIIETGYTFPPTSEPSNIPSIPSSMPTNVPSNMPLVIATNNLTQQNSDQAGYDDVNSDNSNDDSGNSDTIRDYNNTGEYIVGGILGITVLIVLTSHFHSHAIHKKRSDDANYVFIFKFLQNTGDFWTDLLFCFILYFENKIILFGISLFSIVISFVVSCIVAIYWCMKWTNFKEDQTKRLYDYLDKYILVIYGLSLISGTFYSAIDLLRSKLFYIKLFYIPLTRKELENLKAFRLVNVVLLENVPQLGVQIWYLIEKTKSDSSNINSIVFISMVFSVLSILFSGMNAISRLYQCIRPKKDAFTHITTMRCKFVLKSNGLKSCHGLGYNKINSCLNSVLFDENHIDSNRSDTKMFIETYYIRDNISVSKKMTIYWTLKILNLGDLKFIKCVHSKLKELSHHDSKIFVDFKRCLCIALKLENRDDVIIEGFRNEDLNVTTAHTKMYEKYEKKQGNKNSENNKSGTTLSGETVGNLNRTTSADVIVMKTQGTLNNLNLDGHTSGDNDTCTNTDNSEIIYMENTDVNRVASVASTSPLSPATEMTSIPNNIDNVNINNNNNNMSMNMSQLQQVEMMQQIHQMQQMIQQQQMMQQQMPFHGYNGSVNLSSGMMFNNNNIYNNLTTNMAAYLNNNKQNNIYNNGYGLAAPAMNAMTMQSENEMDGEMEGK